MIIHLKRRLPPSMAASPRLAYKAVSETLMSKIEHATLNDRAYLALKRGLIEGEFRCNSVSNSPS